MHHDPTAQLQLADVALEERAAEGARPLEERARAAHDGA